MSKMYGISKRPKKLSEVVGQDLAVRALKEFAKTLEFPQVMLLVGPSGTGKNTLSNIIAATIDCDNLKMNDEGYYDPCGECTSCKNIWNETSANGLSIFNGKSTSIDDINKIEEDIAYGASGFEKNLIYLINEAHDVHSLTKFKAIIEKPLSDTYFILNSTDKNKFKSPKESRNNKDEEKKAMRSRVHYIGLKEISSKEIATYLFGIVSDLFENDDDGFPEEFAMAGTKIIADNSHGNMRQALNDLDVCLKAKAFKPEEILSLLDYTDEEKVFTQLARILAKDFGVLKELGTGNVELEDFFHYSWAVLVSTLIQSKGGFDNEWQEKNALRFLKYNSIEDLLEVYNKTYYGCQSFFKKQVFLSNLLGFMGSKSVEKEKIALPKRQRTPVVG